MIARLARSLVVVLAVAHAAGAETRRPLVTEDAETLPPGRLELQVAVDYIDQFESPTLPLEGPLLSAPIVALNYGVATRAELQVRVPLHNRFRPGGVDPRTGTGDLTLASKLGLLELAGRHPRRLSLRGQVKLPNLTDSSGLGTDETDVSAELLGETRFAPVSLFLSLGYALLGDPTTRASQDDKALLGLGALVALGRVELAVDLHGVAGHDRTLQDHWTALLGAALPVGRVRFDGALGRRSSTGGASLFATVGLTTGFALGGPPLQPKR